MTTQNQASVSVKILIEGTSIKEGYDVKEIRVFKGVNRISSAIVKLVDGSAAKETFSISEGDEFIPGKTIEVQVGFGLKTNTIFKGIVTGQRLRATGHKGGMLTVACRDQVAKMTVGSNSQAFTQMTDSDILSKLIADHGLSAEVGSTSETYPQVVQYDSTDWEFLLSRAEVNGMVVIADGEKVSVKAPTVSGSVDTFTYGDNLIEFDTQLDARTQLGEVSAFAWDYQSQSAIEASASDPTVPDLGNLSGEVLSKVVGPSNFFLQTSGPLNNEELKGWADARLLKSRLAKVRGEVKVFGNSDLVPDCLVSLAGLGKRFNGEVYVSEISHEISDGNWWTNIVLGLDPKWYAKEVDISAPPAAGLLPGTRGLQNAVVKKINEDPLGETRIQVEVPMFKTTSSDGLIWARWTQPYATAGAGQFFMPEIDDEVVLGFLNQDPRYPVILGSLYSSGRPPAYEPTEGDPIKAIVTQSQLKIEFNDEKKIMTLATPGGQQIVLSDEDNSITMTDSNGNNVTMNSDGISLQSPANVDIKADGQVSISGTGGVSINTAAEATVSADASLSISGLEVSISGETSFSASGGADASVSAGGELSLTGAMIMIN